MNGNEIAKTVQPNRKLSYRFSKRLLDIVASLLGLIVLSPVFLVVSLLIYREDKGNVIFCQERNGLNNVVFKMYKFRSMIINAPVYFLFGTPFGIKNTPFLSTSISYLSNKWGAVHSSLIIIF